MKLLLDEMFDPEIAVQLRRHGHDVVAVKERHDLLEKRDPELLQIAQAEQRIVVTENTLDFLNLDHLYREQERTHQGIILTTRRRFDRRGPGGVGRLVRALDALLRTQEGWPAVESPLHWLR